MAEPSFALGELVKLLLALGLTIGLFYALALCLKRMQVGTGRSGNLITVLAALPLGGKEKLWVVDVAGEKLVLGTTPGAINCLHVLQRDAAVSVDSRLRGSDAGSLRGSDAGSLRGGDAGSLRGGDAGSLRGGDAVAPSSFPRMRESSADSPLAEDLLDSRLRGSDAGSLRGSDAGSLRGSDAGSLRGSDAGSLRGSDAAASSSFSELLAKFRNWPRS